MDKFTEEIPDGIEPVVAYKAWWAPLKMLRSYGWSDMAWQFVTPVIAQHKTNRLYIERLKDLKSTHSISNCKSPVFKCGIYGIKTFKTFWLQYQCDRILGVKLVFGQTYLWGLIVEHELGYRAEYAYPKCLYLDGRRNEEIGKIARNYRIPAIEPPALELPVIETEPHFNSLVDIQRYFTNVTRRNTGV